jgi:hypothetical protein
MDEKSKAEAIYTLKLFNEKAAELNDSRWLQSMRDGKGNSNISWKMGEGVTVTHDMPHREELKAYVMDFRLFFLDNESFSFKNLRHLYSSLDEVSQEIRLEALNLIERVKKHLEADSNVIMSGRTVTRRRVFEVAINGGMAHSNNRGNKEIADHWRSRPDLDVILNSHFADILLDLTQKAIFKMRLLNLRALEALGGKAA